MHGATLLDANQQVLRPAILWNDGRSSEECAELERRVPNSRAISGNLMMPGFTAPKLLWVARHEPDVFHKIDKVLLPKDYLRWKMSGVFASDMSDAAGTLWLDVAKRDWSDELLSATGLTRQQMPALFEGSAITGQLQASIAQRWGMQEVPIVAGAGDNAAGAIGVGLYQQGQAMLSLGTSGVYFSVTDTMQSNPEQGVHSFCHALPERWHLMSVILSAASCLDWVCQLTRFESVATLLDAIETTPASTTPLWFLPYLSGERTPHNNPHAKGMFWGLTHQHQATDLGRAVLEGVGFALADGMAALHQCSSAPSSISLIGGGARSPYWRQMLADICGLPLTYRTGSEVGPALGAARLAQIALSPTRSLAELLPTQPLEQLHQPDPKRHHDYAKRHQTFKALYRAVADISPSE
jgi:xylulokinase